MLTRHSSLLLVGLSLPEISGLFWIRTRSRGRATLDCVTPSLEIRRRLGEDAAGVLDRCSGWRGSSVTCDDGARWRAGVFCCRHRRRWRHDDVDVIARHDGRQQETTVAAWQVQHCTVAFLPTNYIISQWLLPKIICFKNNNLESSSFRYSSRRVNRCDKNFSRCSLVIKH